MPSDSKTAAIDISPNASSRQMSTEMAGNSVGADACSPPSGSYVPPAFTYTTADGTTVTETMDGMRGVGGSPYGSPGDRRYSDEWDASKVPPSRFQKRKGSIYSTPGSRDGHVDNNYAAKFHAKHAELGYNRAK
ncbi:hypothetical protein SEPCBS119000_005989 [Sporothrix epigloea]|uniref:C6 zinc finger domain containing protein n=1 Tax=Sporothrix epigloea TaxID=1892477 RepID=A0ABP0E0J6_9PEZI